MQMGTQAVANRAQQTVVAISPIEEVLIGGDLAKLSSEQRLQYVQTLCDVLGLNVHTRPFQYIVLNGKLTLYATKDCSEQLRRKHGVSVTDLEESMLPGDLYRVKASATDASGRVDVATGVLSVKGLSGEALANAMLKAETKAKRRVTLSICGLGMLDETETDFNNEARPTISMPSRRSQRNSTPPPNVDTVTGEVVSDPLWTNKELEEALKGATLTVKDLSPVLKGEANRDNYHELIDEWFFENPGKRVADLIAAAVDYHTGASSAPQAALLATD